MSVLVKESLEKFAFRVKKQSKTNLTRLKKNASKKLYNSIDYDLKVHKNSFSLSFSMEGYGDFMDKGVHGVGGFKADGSQWKKRKVVGSAFRYTNKRPPASAFSDWIVRRGFAPRDKKGRFTSRKSLQFAVANSVYHRGLETTNFFTKPVENEFKKLPNEVIKSYNLQFDSFLNFIKTK